MSQLVDENNPVDLTATQPPVENAVKPTFDDFINRSKPVEEKPVEVKPAEAKPVETAPVEAPIEVAETPAEVKLPEFNPAKPAAKPARDYTGIDEGDLPLFKSYEKKMSDKAFTDFKRLYVENKQLKAQPQVKPGDIPPSFYSNPNGYLLAPEYHKLAQRQSTAQQIVDHWQEQYERIDNDEAWNDLNLDPKTGQLTVSEPQQFRPEEKARLKALMIRHIQASTNQAIGTQQAHDKFVESFKGKQVEAQKSVETMRENFFKGWDESNHPTKPMQDQVRKGLHEVYQDNPLADIVVKGRVLFELAQARIKQLEGELATAKTTKAVVAKAPPSKAQFVEGSNNGVTRPTMDDFNKRLQTQY